MGSFVNPRPPAGGRLGMTECVDWSVIHTVANGGLLAYNSGVFFSCKNHCTKSVRFGFFLRTIFTQRLFLHRFSEFAH